MSDNSGTATPSSGDTATFVEPLEWVRKRRLKIRSGLTILAAFIGVMFAVPLSALAGRPHDQAMFLLVGGSTFAAGGAFVAAILIPISAHFLGNERAALALRPHTVAFTTQRTPELVTALKKIRIGNPKLRIQFAVAVGPQGIELWGAVC